MSNKALSSRVGNPSDEYYTTRASIEKEFEHWSDLFRGKRVVCPCDSQESEFVKFFLDNFERLGLRSLEHYGYNYKKNCWEYGIMYGPSSYWLQGSYNDNPDDVNDIQKGMIASCDIVVTNPPFSIIRKFYDAVKCKQFFILVHLSFISYSCVKSDVRNLYAGYATPKCKGDKKLGNLMWCQNVGNVSRETPFMNELFEPEGIIADIQVPSFSKVAKAPKSFDNIFAVPLSAFPKIDRTNIEILAVKSRPVLEDGRVTFARLLVKYKEV